jgi:hypothetical protein
VRIALLVVVGCSGAPQHASDRPTERPVAQPMNTVPRPAPSVRPVPPTLATAGATTCSLDDAVVLGPHGGSDVVVGFAASGGLAVWISAPGVLSIQALTSDGAKFGTGYTAAIQTDVEPFAIEPRGDSYAIVLRHWDWRTRDLSWWSVVVESSGQVRTNIAASAAPVVPASEARPADTLDFAVTNGAVPPPRGPGGRIIEAMGRPMLDRTHDTLRVGDATALEWRGNPIARGMNVSMTIVWSGTRFIYPFWAADRGDTYIVALLPIDCRP